MRGVGKGGEELFALSFGMPRVDHADGASSFAFALPARPGWGETLASVTLTGPSGSATLDATTGQTAVMALDRRTGAVRAILRDVAPAALASGVAADLAPDVDVAELEVLISRGIPDPADWPR